MRHGDVCSWVEYHGAKHFDGLLRNDFRVARGGSLQKWNEGCSSLVEIANDCFWKQLRGRLECGEYMFTLKKISEPHHPTPPHEQHLMVKLSQPKNAPFPNYASTTAQIQAKIKEWDTSVISGIINVEIWVSLLVAKSSKAGKFG
jgi:hypothetical protein